MVILNIYIGKKYRRCKADFSLGESTKFLIEMKYAFYRKIPPRNHFDNFAQEMEKNISKYPEDQNLKPIETIFANKDMSRMIGDFLGPRTPSSGKGGRRKTKRTRRTRKNKRKSIRRIRGKKNNIKN